MNILSLQTIKINDFIISNTDKYSGIYAIINNINNKIYIGASKNIYNRFLKHKNNKRQLISNEIYKYGVNNFSFIILEHCPLEKLDERECYYIEKYKTKYPKGYNISDGGKSKMMSSEIARKKISDIKKMQWEDPMYRKETIEKVRKSLSDGRMCGDKNPRYGQHCTQETKDKISLANSNKVILDGQEFLSYSKAAKYLNVTCAAISYGVKYNKLVKGKKLQKV